MFTKEKEIPGQKGAPGPPGPTPKSALYSCGVFLEPTTIEQAKDSLFWQGELCRWNREVVNDCPIKVWYYLWFRDLIIRAIQKKEWRIRRSLPPLMYERVPEEPVVLLTHFFYLTLTRKILIPAPNKLGVLKKLRQHRPHYGRNKPKGVWVSKKWQRPSLNKENGLLYSRW